MWIVVEFGRIWLNVGVYLSSVLLRRSCCNWAGPVILINSLSPKLKTSLIGIDLLRALNAYVNIINKRYNNILCLIPKYAP